MIETLVTTAARNNASLCTKVLAAHGIASRQSPTLWQADAPPIPFYPAAVTLAPNAVVPRVPGAIKDSFNDLTPTGYDLGLQGSWWQVRSTQTPAAHPEPDLPGWCRDWGEDAATFPASLSTDPDLIFARTATGGGLLNRGGGAIGISNTFGPTPWTALATLGQHRWPGLPVVMWLPEGEVADDAQDDLIRLGPMRVWFPATQG